MKPEMKKLIIANLPYRFEKMTVLPTMLLPRCQVRCRANLLKVLYLQGIFFSGNKSNGEIKEKSKNSK